MKRKVQIQKTAKKSIKDLAAYQVPNGQLIVIKGGGEDTIIIQDILNG